MREAASKGAGWAIRHSETTGISYMYFARRSDIGFVRLAMPLTHIDSLVRDLRFILLYARS